MVSVSSNLFRLKGNAFWQGLANYVYRSDISLLHLHLCSLVDETEANFYWVIISLFKSIQIKRFVKNLNMLWSYIYIFREDWILFNSDLIAVILDDSCYLLAMSPRCDPRCIQLSATSHCGTRHQLVTIKCAKPGRTIWLSTQLHLPLFPLHQVDNWG